MTDPQRELLVAKLGTRARVWTVGRA